MKARRWLPPLLWAGVILVGTSLPSSAVPGQVSTIDKILHFTVYTILGFLLSGSLAEVMPRWRAATMTIAAALVFAAADEWHQRFIPGRSPELADWHADVAGSVVGTVIGILLHRRGRPKAQTT